MRIQIQAKDGKGATRERGVASPAGRPVGDGVGFFRGADGGTELGGIDDDAPYAALVAVPVNGVATAILVLGDTDERVLVDGFPPLPISVLDDRAELSVQGALVAFRAHSATETTSFDGLAPETCIRCERPLAAGDLVRRCGRCGASHHEGERADGRGPLQCFSYDPACARCSELLDEGDSDHG